MRLRGKQIVISGGSGGLGTAICVDLLKRGAEVTVIGRQEPKLPNVGFIRADLATEEGLSGLEAQLAERRCDILINLAGLQHFGPFEHQDPTDLQAHYVVNLIAPARLTRAVLPGMKARGSGWIVNIGSIFGSINFAHFAAYSSAKAGLRALSQALRRELTGSGVGVTYVAPRAVRTAFNSEAVLGYARISGMAMDEPKAVAERIVGALRRQRREVYLGFPESLFVRINAVWPGLVDRALRAKDRKARALFPSNGADR